MTGASRGIGRAIAITLAKAGANVAVHYHRERELAEQVVRECEAHDVQAVAIQADVRDEGDVKRLFIESTQLGIPSILVNNAGVSDYGLVIDMTLERWRTLVDVNLTSMFLCTREAIPYLRRVEHGRIVNLASIHGMDGAAMEAAYSATKGGVIAWTKAVAKELATLGITVNAVSPGAIDTDMMAQFDDAERLAIAESTPIGRLGQPEDVAALVTFLASPEASFITGQNISPNGGLST